METELGKVIAFITRDVGVGHELLVFQHPTAGIQLPAGTVEPQETPESAVLREVAEETGLTEIAFVELLDTMTQPLDPDERMILRSAVLQASPGDGGTLHKGIVLMRGQTVRVIGDDGAYDRVTYPQYLKDGDTFQVVSSKTGWLPHRFLTANVQRYLFHLTLNESPPNRWSVDADGHKFSLFWVSLAQETGLISTQQAWLDHVLERL